MFPELCEVTDITETSHKTDTKRTQNRHKTQPMRAQLIAKVNATVNDAVWQRPLRLRNKDSASETLSKQQ